MSQGGSVFKINGSELKVPMDYNCKNKYVIYCAQCTLCSEVLDAEDTYFGQTLNKLHIRMNGHRNKFNNEDFQKSALAIHAFERHPENFSLDIFKFCVFKEVHPLNLNREEFKYIEKFKTNGLGINRCKVRK